MIEFHHILKSLKHSQLHLRPFPYCACSYTQKKTFNILKSSKGKKQQNEKIMIMRGSRLNQQRRKVTSKAFCNNMNESKQPQLR